MDTITYNSLRFANLSRQSRWDSGNRLTLSYRANEMAGEVGEACNVAKKIERERLGIPGSRATKAQLASELADVVICADLVAASEDIDLEQAVADTFNAKSEQMGFPERLAVARMIHLGTQDSYATLEQMQAWAAAVMSRQPDFIIRKDALEPDYLRRWWIIPRSEFSNVYLHEILRSDDDRALHDHPWDSTSILIEGGYWEYTPEGRFWRQAGDVVNRKAADAHRLEIPEGGRAVSLFITGPKVRDWGFHCPQGWKPWQAFVAKDDKGSIGAGCGEYDFAAADARSREEFAYRNDPERRNEQTPEEVTYDAYVAQCIADGRTGYDFESWCALQGGEA